MIITDCIIFSLFFLFFVIYWKSTSCESIYRYFQLGSPLESQCGYRNSFNRKMTIRLNNTDLVHTYIEKRRNLTQGKILFVVWVRFWYYVQVCPDSGSCRVKSEFDSYKSCTLFYILY